MEVSEKRFKLFLEVILVIVLLGLIYNSIFINDSSNAHEKAFKYSKELNFNGTVVEKTRDKANHNNPILVLSNGKRVNVFDVFHEKIRVNDSIVKVKDSLFIKIFRNNDVITLDFNDELKLMK